jgi:hypothetical protein
LKTKNQKIRNNGETSNPGVEEGYCNEAITAVHPLKVRAAKARIYPRGKQRDGLNKGTNKISYMALYVLQKPDSYNSCTKCGDEEIQTACSNHT